MFTEQEANALITAAQIINQNQDRSLVVEYENAILKIKSVLRGTQQDKIQLLSRKTPSSC